MKLTLKQLKQLIREQVEEYGMEEADEEEAPRTSSPRIRLYAHKNKNGKIRYHIESDSGTHGLMTKEEILEWISDQLEVMEDRLMEDEVLDYLK
jgi:hypothetical protein